jgi:hypothetical protein
VTPVYWFEKGKIRVEEKEQIKKRLKFSPDEADSLAMTYACADMPGAMSTDDSASRRWRSRASCMATHRTLRRRTKGGGVPRRLKTAGLAVRPSSIIF